MSAPHPDGERGRVLPFRQREKPRPAPGATGPVKGLERFSGDEQADDYRQRMINNGLGLGVIVVLIVLGIWIATTMAEMRKKQDCVLSGRRDCANVAVSPGPK